MRKGQITKAITQQLKEGRNEKATHAAEYGVFKLTKKGVPAKYPLNTHRTEESAAIWQERAAAANPGKTFVVLPLC